MDASKMARGTIREGQDSTPFVEQAPITVGALARKFNINPAGYAITVNGAVADANNQLLAGEHTVGFDPVVREKAVKRVHVRIGRGKKTSG